MLKRHYITPKDTYTVGGNRKVIYTPVVVVEDEDAALFVAGAFLEAGLRQIEITLRSRASMKALEAVAGRFPAMKVAAGTVLEPAQVTAARDAGEPRLLRARHAARLAHLLRHARVGHDGRVVDQAFDAAQRFRQGEDLNPLQHPLRPLQIAVDQNGDHAAVLAVHLA